MNILEKKKLHEAEFLLEQIVEKVDKEATAGYKLAEPSISELLDLIRDLKLRFSSVLLDLEATRREKDYLLKVVEELNKEQ